MIHHTVNDTTSTVGQSVATVIADTVSTEGKRITTFELVYPRYIHSELMTHRCLTADTVLTFDLPSGSHGIDYRPYTMTLGEFWDKWENGSAPHASRWGTTRRCDMKGRLNKMRLRAVDESNLEVTHTTITDCWKVGIKPVYKLTAGEYSVTCTADHLILTDKGWKELQDIVPNCDKVYCNTRKKFTEKRFDPYKKIGGQWVSRWTKKVLPEVCERQDFKCADCGYPDASLEIHHVVPKHENPDLAFDVNNVVALCKDCHKTRHKTQGWQGCSQCNVTEIEVDLIEYIGEEEVFDISVSSEYHNFLANGITVHNCFSRNASSSRATPLSVTLKEVNEDPVFFDFVGRNQSGMVAGEELTGEELKQFKRDWNVLGKMVAYEVERMSDAYGIHKQTLNRALEPWLRIRTLVTSTEWDNFFKLRLAEDAQPEIRSLAKAMKAAMEKSTPVEADVHVPYTKPGDSVASSVARCARVSYARLDGKETSVDADNALYQQLLDGGHYSPFEHVAYAREGQWANFNGWRSLRNVMGR